MSELLQLVSITLNGSPVRACSYSVELNGSVDWSAMVSAVDFDASAITDASTFTLAASVQYISGDGTPATSMSWTSPTLVCSDPEEYSGHGGEYVTLHGTDQASYLLTQTGLASSTIHDAMAQTLANTIATLAGTTVTFTGSPVNWRVEDFEIVGEQGVGEYLKRLCRDGGWRFRPASSSGIEICNVEYNVSAPGTLYWGDWHRTRRNSQRYSQLNMQLSRKYKSQYVFPVDETAEAVLQGDLSPGLAVSTLTAVDATTGGRIQYAAFYTGPSGGGSLCGFIALDPGAFPVTPTSSDDALSVVYKVLAPSPPVTVVNGNLIITGRPTSAYTYDAPCTVATTPIGGARTRILKLESTLWDTETFMTDRSTHILDAANSGTDVIEFSNVRFDPRFNAGDSVDPSGLPSCRIQSSSWSYSDGRVSQSITAHVV